MKIFNLRYIGVYFLF